MFWTTFLTRRTFAAGLLIARGVVISAESTEGKGQSARGPDGNALAPAMVKTGLFVISGGGCNSLLRLSANGFIVVDGKLPGNYEAIVALTKKLSYSEQPIRILINTDYHENHTGNNSKFLEAGTVILAHENVRHNLANYSPRGGRVTLPTKTYGHDFKVRLGGIELQLLHFGNAHTSGDTVVYFPNLKVVAVGDLFSAAPDPDFVAGGSLVSWAAVLAEILKLDFDVVVPSTGPLVTRADLEAFRVKIDILVTRATQLVRKGVPKNQLMAELKTDDLGWRFSFTGTRLDLFYAELSRTK